MSHPAPYLLPALFFIGCTACFGGKSPVLSAELEETLAAPPVAEGAKSQSFEVPKETDGGAIVESDAFIAFITISDSSGDGATYRFRTYSKKDKLEISGDGRVFEHYYRVKDPANPSSDTRVVDKGSQLYIDIGLTKILWSQARYIYVPVEYKVTSGSEDYYTQLVAKQLKPRT